MSGNDPMLVLAVNDPQGKPTDSPLFAAVRVTASLCKRLRLLASLSKKHLVDTMNVQHRDAPIYWDFPPDSALEGCMENYSQWEMIGSTIYLQFWGSLQMDNGEFSGIQMLAVSTVLDVEILEDLRASGSNIDYLEDEDTEEVLGYPFALSVHERFIAMSKLRGEQPTG